MRERDRPIIGMKMFVVYFISALIIGAEFGYFLATENVGYIYPPQTEETELTQLHEEVKDLTKLIYGAMGASLIAALAAVVNIMLVYRRMS